PDARPGGAGDGVWWLLVDGQYAGLSMSEIIDLPNDARPTLAPGPHILTASLRGRDGQPLPGGADSSIHIMVTGCTACPPARPPPPSPPPLGGHSARLPRAGLLPFCPTFPPPAP